MALLLTFISGLFFLIGMFVYTIVKHKKELTVGAMACAFVVMLGLIGLDLGPELLEIKKWYLIIWIIVGFVFLILIDKLIPHHHHDHKANDEEGKEHQEHLSHISFITILALLLHNFVEGMALYNLAFNNLTSGILMMLGIGLHNLPFGFQIANYGTKAKNKLAIILLVISGLIGGLAIWAFGNISEFVTRIIIALTLGMILYILIFELLHEVWGNIRQKASLYGIIVGVIILVLINLI